MEHLLSIALNLFLSVVLVICGFYGVYQWIKAIKHMFAMTFHYQPGVNKWGKETIFNPFNGMWRRDLLTETGVKHAKKCTLAVVKFVIAILVPFTLAYVTELITGAQLIFS